MVAKKKKTKLSPFGRWLVRYKISRDTAVEALEISRQMVYNLSRGDNPGLELAFRIRDWTRSVAPSDFISVDSWRSENPKVFKTLQPSPA
jgi:hypothetical protein